MCSSSHGNVTPEYDRCGIVLVVNSNSYLSHTRDIGYMRLYLQVKHNKGSRHLEEVSKFAARPGVYFVWSCHCRTASATDYFVASSQYKTLLPAWSQALVVVTTSHQCYSSCTGCQSVSESCSRSRGSYTSRSVELLPRTMLTTVAFCRTLVVAHCGPVPMTRGSCSCREHIIHLVIGVSRPPVLDCATIFHPDYGGRDCPSISSNNL